MATTKPVTDGWVQTAVLKELKWDARVHPNEIGVAVSDGVVTLMGLVDSYAKRWAAEEAAQRVRGVRAVANDIEVRLPLGAGRPDADLAAAVMHALEWDALVPTDKLDVSVSHGIVTLRGEVPRRFQKLDAERVTRRIKGIKGVNNLIAVQACVVPSELKQKIEAALVRNAQMDAERIVVEVQGGKVTLSGIVRSWTEALDADWAVSSSPGVTEVINQLVVQPPAVAASANRSLRTSGRPG
jgi:osmotically-inducible protein OsmY